MKVIKLTKSMLKDPETLLLKLGAFHKNEAFPELVYISSRDYKVLRNNVKKAIKSKYGKIISKHKLDFAVEMNMFDLGPSLILSKAIKPGYVLVNDEAIEKKKKEISV